MNISIRASGEIMHKTCELLRWLSVEQAVAAV
jgi:hypothetical protein